MSYSATKAAVKSLVLMLQTGSALNNKSVLIAWVCTVQGKDALIIPKISFPKSEQGQESRQRCLKGWSGWKTCTAVGLGRSVSISLII